MRARESAPIRFVRELGLPKGERRAARAERRAEEAMRRERDNTESNRAGSSALEADAAATTPTSTTPRSHAGP